MSQHERRTRTRDAATRTLRTVVKVTSALVPLVLLAAPATAVDGVVDINQSRVLQGFLTEEDEPGFPLTLRNPGTYRLTSDLVVDNPNLHAIEVSSDVAIDLNGFSIVGPTTCMRPPVVCTPTGFGVGVVGEDVEVRNVTVRNGTIRGMAGNGILLFDDSRVQRVRAIGNGGDGIQMGRGGSVIDSSAILNGKRGIDAPGETDVTVTGNIASVNGEEGIRTGDGARIAGNAVAGNASVGIDTGTGSTVSGNTAFENLGLGLSLTGGSGYGHNVLTSNNGDSANPQVSDLGIQTGGNVCGDDLCP